MPRISVIVPFHDAARWLPACLDGLARQTLPPDQAEFLFVDNNSQDDGPAIVQRRAWARLLQESSPGAYAARNRALREARADVIAFLDPDCIPAADWLERIASGTADPGVGILIGGYTLGDRPASVRPLIAYENEKTWFVYGAGDPTAYFGHTNNMAIRRSLLAGMGGFLERRRGSDTIFVRQAIDRYGTGIARADEGLLVSHLEVGTLAGYYRKMFIYGRSRESYRGTAHTRSLTLRERWAVFRRTARRQQYPAPAQARLLALLGVGLACWASGRAVGFLDRTMLRRA